MNKLLYIILIIQISLCNLFSDDIYYWKYKDWAIDKSDDSILRMSTNGKAINGHLFGIVKKTNTCENDFLWLSLSTYKAEVKIKENQTISFELSIDEKKHPLKLKVRNLSKLTPFIDLLLFENLSLNKAIIEDLKKSSNVELKIIDNHLKKFKIQQDSFSLKGFVANYTKLEEMCKNSILEEKEYTKKSTSLEENANKGVEKYNKREALSTLIFSKIYKKFGADIRHGVILDVCGMENISKRIAPKSKEIQDFISEKIPNDITKTDIDYFFSIISSTYSRVVGYKLGYLESQRVMKDVIKDYCKMSDKIILENKNKL